MSEKVIRSIMTAVLLALVMSINKPAVIMSLTARAATPPAMLAMEHGTTGS